VTENGSIFAPGGVELALYIDVPGAPAWDRQNAIEARCYVKNWGATETTSAGWCVEFETADGELGFEIGRWCPDRTVIFWADRLRDLPAREKAIAIARRARLS
jgi:hypothetical protein